MSFDDLLLGTDLVFVPRLAENMARLGEDFFAKILNDDELAYCQSNPKHFLKRAASHVAVKEATAKALGIGISGLGWESGSGWKEIAVVSKSQSPPGLSLSGRALEAADRLGVRFWRVSLSHESDYAMATVVGLISCRQQPLS